MFLIYKDNRINEEYRLYLNIKYFHIGSYNCQQKVLENEGTKLIQVDSSVPKALSQFSVFQSKSLHLSIWNICAAFKCISNNQINIFSQQVFHKDPTSMRSSSRPPVWATSCLVSAYVNRTCVICTEENSSVIFNNQIYLVLV